MKDLIFDEFQASVNDCLIRHRSILDIITKLDESQARVNRSLVKCVTDCGCLKINANKQHIPENLEKDDLDSVKDYFNTHVSGSICDDCREILEKEIGNHLFYINSMCNVLNINLYDVLLKEYKNLSTLGKFNLK